MIVTDHPKRRERLVDLTLSSTSLAHPKRRHRSTEFLPAKLH